MTAPNNAERFRTEVRNFLENNLPADMASRNRTAVHQTKQDAQAWITVLARQGWSVPSWPVEFGGPGWSALERYIFEEECMLAGAPWLNIQGVFLIGPVLHAYGTEAQRRRYLANIVDGSEFWSQGFSEPNAGSDLASLRTRAVRDGDDYVIDGQKIWTTGAMDSDMLFCLVRTSSEGKPQAGISFILVPTDAPGVTVRPIKSLDEGYSLCEVFFEAVRVPVANLVGVEGQGWEIARFLLAGERISGADLPRSKRNLDVLKEIASGERQGNQSLIEDPVFAHQIARLEIDLLALEAAILDVLTNEAKYDGIPVASLVKLHGSELMQSLLKLEVDALGAYGAAYYAQGHDLLDGRVAAPGPGYAPNISAEYFYRRAATIYGGSNEVQKNIVSKALFAMAAPPQPLFEDDDQRILAESVERFVVRDYGVEQRRALLEKGREAQRAIWSTFADMGWLGAALPEDVDGLGGGAASVAIIAERLGRGLVLEPYVGAAVLAGELIDRLAQGDSRRALLSELIAGTRLFGVAHDEAEARGDLRQVKATARRSGSQWVISCRKIMVLGGALCDTFLVSARTAGAGNVREGISVFAVDARADGLTLQSYRTIDHRLVADVVLNDVVVPADALLGDEGQAIDALERAYDGATLAICAETVGVMDRAFWIARDYLSSRKQFGSSLSEFQVLRHRLVDMYVELEMARAIVSSAASSIDRLEGAQRRMLVAAVKSRVGRASHLVGTQAVQLHGGIGMADEYIVGQYLKRVHVNEALFGNANFHTGVRAVALGHRASSKQ